MGNLLQSSSGVEKRMSPDSKSKEIISNLRGESEENSVLNHFVWAKKEMEEGRRANCNLLPTSHPSVGSCTALDLCSCTQIWQLPMMYTVLDLHLGHNSRGQFAVLIDLSCAGFASSHDRRGQFAVLIDLS